MYVHRLRYVGDLVDANPQPLFICYLKRPDKFDKLLHSRMLMENGVGISYSHLSTTSNPRMAPRFICM